MNNLVRFCKGLIALGISVLVTALVVTGCVVATPAPVDNSLVINEVEIRNVSRVDVHDLKIKVTENNAVFECGVVVRGGYCSYGFGERPYEGNSITISWERDGRKIVEGPLVVAEPDVLADGAYKVVFELKPGGGFDAYFELQARR